MKHPTPQGLGQLSTDAYRGIFFRGNPSLVTSACLGIVGSRRPVGDSRRAGWNEARKWGREGWTIVSGLARGVDSLAHKGALSVGAPTIGVLAHGLDRCYPPENRDLAEEIVDKGGCLLSEYPLGVAPLPSHFPRRNHLIARLCQNLIVIQASFKSGSMITARAALDLGRELWVLPGSGAEFGGSHRLIEQGAHLLSEEGMEPSIRNERDPYFRLEAIFKTLGGEASLGDLFASNRWMLSDWMRELDAAMAAGWVLELDAQRYCWVGDRSLPNEVPSRTIKT